MILACDPGGICDSPIGESAFFFTAIEIFASIAFRKTEHRFDTWIHKNYLNYTQLIFVTRTGFEPVTNCLKGNCSTIELAGQFVPLEGIEPPTPPFEAEYSIR